MSAEISTWQKAKDAALIGFVALASAGMVKLIVDVADLKVQVAVYQGRLEDVRVDLRRVQVALDEHLRETKPARPQ